MPRPPSSSPAIDLAKVLAAHLILFHHVVLYGPLPDAPAPALERVLDWLAADGRLAVQVFLVIGGYLGAASMLGRIEHEGPVAPLRQGVGLIAARARRLLPTYWLAALLMLAVAGWLHWGLGTDDAPAPDAPQVVANLLLLHDVMGYDGLSAGFWYVAIDLQLYAGLVLLAMLCRRLGSPASRVAAFVAVTVLTVLGSLLRWNLHPELDAWAPYFAGSYGLGMLACLLRRRAGVGTAGAAALVGLLGLAALVLAWRSRIAVATVTAVALCGLRAADGRLQSLPAAWRHGLSTLAAASYPMFLLHYPLLVGLCGTAAALSDDPRVLGGAVVACWPLSVAAGVAVQRRLAGRLGGARRRGPVAPA